MKLIHIIFNLLYYTLINRNNAKLFFGAKHIAKERTTKNIQINVNKNVKLFSRAKENTQTIINNTNEKNKITKIEYILVDGDLHPCFIIDF
jgi:hypothetical protein